LEVFRVEAGVSMNLWNVDHNTEDLDLELKLMFTTTTTTTTRSRWNIGPQQLSVAEVSVAFTFFFFFVEAGLLALCSIPQPGGPGLHIYIPWRLYITVYPSD
jgi:hypothetical protein